MSAPSPALARRRPLPSSWPTLAAIVLVVTGLAVAGAVTAAGVLVRGAPPTGVPASSLPAGPFGVGQDVPTTFGVVAVESVEKVKGLTAKNLGGMTHIQGVVRAGKMQENVSVTMTNLTTAPIHYSPTQFRLLVGDRKQPVSEVRASIVPGTLQPDAAVDGRLSFVVPATGQRLWLGFDDPGRERPILIDLGRTGRQTPDSAFDRFHKGH